MSGKHDDEAGHEAGRRTQEDLRAGEERLRLALLAGRMGTWEWHIATNLVIWSAGLEAIHGLEPGTFPGTFEAYQQDMHPEDRDRVLAAISRTHEHGEDHHIEYRIVIPDGRTRWVEGRGKLFRDEFGRPARMIGVCSDVTQRKEAELALKQALDRQKLLLDELNHRVRNTLAIAQSIASQTLRETPEPEAFNETFSARLAALARAHSLLTRTLWQGASLADLVSETFTPFAGESRSEAIHVEGPRITVRPNAAVSLCLVLHELATNAAKHGALGVAEGEISVTWTRGPTASEDADWVELEWRERNGPPVSAPKRQGFGSRLIAATADQLGGDVRIDYAPSGLRCTLRFPLAGNEAAA